MKLKTMSKTLALVMALMVFFYDVGYAKPISNKLNATFDIAKSIFYVSTVDEYNLAYNNAQDGDTIVIKDNVKLSFISTLDIEKSVTLKAETEGKASIELGNVNTQINLWKDGIVIEGLVVSKTSAGGNMLNLNNADNVTVKNSKFIGCGDGNGIHLGNINTFNAGKDQSTDNGAATNAVISKNEFSNLTCGIYISQGMNVIISENKYENIDTNNKTMGFVHIDSSSKHELLSSINIVGNIAKDNSNLSSWNNTDVEDCTWFDKNVTLDDDNVIGQGIKLQAAYPLMLRLDSQGTINNITHGTQQILKFTANKVSKHINLGNVRYLVKWATNNGAIGDVVVKYNNQILIGTDGVYSITATPGIEGTYEVQVVFNRRGTYTAEIFAEDFE